MDKFTLINKDRSRIKVFEPFENLSKPSLSGFPEKSYKE